MDWWVPYFEKRPPEQLQSNRNHGYERVKGWFILNLLNAAPNNWFLYDWYMPTWLAKCRPCIGQRVTRWGWEPSSPPGDLLSINHQFETMHLLINIRSIPTMVSQFGFHMRCVLMVCVSIVTLIEPLRANIFRGCFSLVSWYFTNHGWSPKPM